MNKEKPIRLSKKQYKLYKRICATLHLNKASQKEAYALLLAKHTTSRLRFLKLWSNWEKMARASAMAVDWPKNIDICYSRLFKVYQPEIHCDLATAPDNTGIIYYHVVKEEK